MLGGAAGRASSRRTTSSWAPIVIMLLLGFRVFTGCAPACKRAAALQEVRLLALRHQPGARLDDAHVDKAAHRHAARHQRHLCGDGPLNTPAGEVSSWPWQTGLENTALLLELSAGPLQPLYRGLSALAETLQIATCAFPSALM